MINSIINAIAESLKNIYNFKIYINEVPQNFKAPCFFIKLVSTTEKQIIGNRFQVTSVFGIDFIDEENGKNVRLAHEIAEKLNEVTHLLTLENKDVVRGANRNTELSEGNLHYFVQYSYFIYRGIEELEKMEDLKHSGGVKN
nr:MAG TPA: tail completion protein [Caudoviricetes sp.]